MLYSSLVSELAGIARQRLPDLRPEWPDVAPFQLSAVGLDGCGFPLDVLVFNGLTPGHPLPVYGTHTIHALKGRCIGEIHLVASRLKELREHELEALLRLEIAACVDSFWNLGEARLQIGKNVEIDDIRSDHATLFGIPKCLERESVIESTNAVGKSILRWCSDAPQMIYSLTPRQFEELVCEAFSSQGYDVSLTPQSRDGGFDIFASKRSVLGPELLLVECKRYSPPNRVGIEIVQRLHGVASAMRATRGILATSSFFTAPAMEFVQTVPHQVGLVDYLSLQHLLYDARH